MDPGCSIYRNRSIDKIATVPRLERLAQLVERVGEAVRVEQMQPLEVRPHVRVLRFKYLNK